MGDRIVSTPYTLRTKLQAPGFGGCAGVVVGCEEIFPYRVPQRTQTTTSCAKHARQLPTLSRKRILFQVHKELQGLKASKSRGMSVQSGRYTRKYVLRGTKLNTYC